MASKWETSPRMRKTFMALVGLLRGEGSGALSAGGEGEGREFFPPQASTERTLSSGSTFLFSPVPSPLFCQRKVQAPLSPGRKHLSPARRSSWTSPSLTFPPRWIFSLSAQGLALPAPGRRLGFVPLRAPG